MWKCELDKTPLLSGASRLEVRSRKLRDSKWTGGNHEIRRISEYNGLVFFLVCRMVSRKTPNFTGLGTIYDGLTYSIAYKQARKQG